ncbi:hypothetical protein [Sediminivirga luteola]|jgi:hypothetical protein|uniref:DNA-directed RNA polymerase subunit beta n=1 Tax=Sediminivirga luteola TaxID=1774748 RepID=A0A8J2XKE4_9MICO|nr:hypothetical protein [Sediminivirga luteola]MCI2266803.1 hypothetical protein [Sediminivirga luteola]GGA13806.1 hypothetical protein GCM10011333_15880 [Sediminivirga luteola]
MNEAPRFRRPLALATLEGLRTDLDTATRVEAAHATAAMLVSRGQREADEESVRRFVHLAEEIGLEVIADMWATAPAVSLPGALWRLYVIREWIHSAPSQVAAEFQAGQGRLDVDQVISGVENPPGPDSVRTAADEILAGVFTGDLGMTLLRAAAFVRIVALGRAALHRRGEAQRGPEGLQAMATDLQHCALAWRSGDLD